MKRVLGLDPIRIILALIVVLGHASIPSIPHEGSKYLRYLDLGIKAMVPNGLGAVMAFFVISGFVIHYPFATGKTINIPEFYSRRILRVALPAIAALIIYYFFDVELTVIWSLICEVFYYFLYPLILKYKEKYFKQMLIGSFVLSYLMTLNYTLFADGDYNGNFHRDGFLLTWIVGLPVWLLGVLLADQYQKELQHKEAPTYKLLWIWRICVYGIASFILILRFQANIPYGYTMPLFGILTFAWIKKEILYYKDKQESALLSYGGIISYSVYLVHILILHLSKEYLLTTALGNYSLVVFIISVLLVIVASWVFYNLIEKPSHKIARSIKF
ncbi:acyltransferase family protein [Flavobacterium sp. Sd200]|uniref:acyltransferase family protein n=1 Tax=Flavobacterium sp. Sd200 TaxID=2692211 RepID=UPI001371F255|nr:acyltransferase [Flavobacterium sp. Sd200]MXN91966.1 acyltransferase family protein [Flavobacterium sp. Sd200]